MNEERSNAFISFSLPRNVILRGKFFFDRLFQRGHSLHTSSLLLKFVVLSQEPSEFRIAFVTPKRLGKAVIRNKARRRMREAFRLNQHHLRTLCLSHNVGFQGALMCKQAHAELSDFVNDYTALCQQFAHHLTSKHS